MTGEVHGGDQDDRAKAEPGGYDQSRRQAGFGRVGVHGQPRKRIGARPEQRQQGKKAPITSISFRSHFASLAVIPTAEARTKITAGCKSFICVRSRSVTHGLRARRPQRRSAYLEG